MGKKRKQRKASDQKMSKRIFITDEFKEECLVDFKKMLESTKAADGKISFSKILAYSNRSASLYFDVMAWNKMKSLIKSFSTEVAWHGIAERLGDESNDEYIIRDIFVYPQVVTGAHVDTDQAEYENWLEALPDEQFNRLRMQGHSHVNMSVTPSGVDAQNQGNILNTLRDDDFYIFMIWNKKGDSHIEIYDYKKNVLFEEKDISTGLYDPNRTDISAFVAGAKAVVTEQKYTPPTQSGTYNYQNQRYGAKTGSKPRLKPYELEESGKTKSSSKSKYSMYDDDDAYSCSGYYDEYGNYRLYSYR